MSQRPLGITIIAALEIFGVLLGTLLLIISPGWLINFGKEILSEFYQIYLIYFSIMLLVSLIVAVGLLKGLRWAWTMILIIHGIAIITAILQLNILSIIFALIIIYYLTRPHVKVYFGITQPP